MADSVTIDSLATELANALFGYSEAVTEDVMKAIDRKFPVSKSALYSYYGVPEPKDEDDAFIMPTGSEVMLSDSGKPKDVQKNFRFF